MSLKMVQYANAARCGARIRELREEQSMTLKEMAQKTGFTHQLLSKVELGGTNTPIETLAKIADALGVKLASLLDDEASASADEAAQEPIHATPAQVHRLMQEFGSFLAQKKGLAGTVHDSSPGNLYPFHFPAPFASLQYALPR